MKDAKKTQLALSVARLLYIRFVLLHRLVANQVNEKRLGWQHVNHVDIQKRKREGTRHKIFVQPGLLKLPFGLAHTPLTKNSVV